MAFHGSVVRRDRSGEPARWIASINSSALGEFLEREIAMHRVEELVEASMVLALLKPCQDEFLKIWPVDKMIGNVRNNGPQLILPVLSNAVPA